MSNPGQMEFDWDAQAAAEERDERPAEPVQAPEKILERIKKLLRLAADKRGNPNESQRAAALAFELAERHHVDIASLDLDEKVEALLGEYFPLGSRLDRVSAGALRIVRAFFNVETCLSFPRVLFVGRETDVAIAGYVFEFLRRTAKDCLRAFEKGEKKARRKMNLTKRANYVTGFFWAITGKLHNAKDAMALDYKTSALVVAEKAKREQKLNELVPSMTTVKSPAAVNRNMSALRAGLIDGSKTNIHQPLENAPGAQPLRLK